jgi:hypothetical protein
MAIGAGLPVFFVDRTTHGMSLSKGDSPFGVAISLSEGV